MRIPLTIAASVALAQSGCSVMIARSGTDPSSLKTQDEVHATFGDPIATKQDDASITETFRTRRKLEGFSAGYGMEFVMSLGTSEPKNTWAELSNYGRTILDGQQLDFQYDNQGNVSSWSTESTHKR